MRSISISEILIEMSGDTYWAEKFTALVSIPSSVGTVYFKIPLYSVFGHDKKWLEYHRSDYKEIGDVTFHLSSSREIKTGRLLFISGKY